MALSNLVGRILQLLPGELPAEPRDQDGNDGLSLIKLASGDEIRVDRDTLREILPIILSQNQNVRISASSRLRRISTSLPLTAFSLLKSPLACLGMGAIGMAVIKYFVSK